ncbi:hypothetical protein [Streptomyces sp. NBC_01497]|uniref:hypothetical protein n=1 Tax=Streptomyces sp. NBC_01497 TaxID=2903885 RepID=UPI002E31076C|nr:hypothetical protein [Streptomyces sp. NBC_01497]
MSSDDALEKIMDRMSPDNRSWVEKQSKQQRKEMLEYWQDKGGGTSLGGVEEETSDIDADSLVQEWRNRPH